MPADESALQHQMPAVLMECFLQREPMSEDNMSQNLLNLIFHFDNLSSIDG